MSDSIRTWIDDRLRQVEHEILDAVMQGQPVADTLRGYLSALRECRDEIGERCAIVEAPKPKPVPQDASGPSVPSPGKVKSVVAQSFGVPVSALTVRSPGGIGGVSKRQVARWFAVHVLLRLGLSHPETAKALKYKSLSNLYRPAQKGVEVCLSDPQLLASADRALGQLGLATLSDGDRPERTTGGE